MSEKMWNWVGGTAVAVGAAGLVAVGGTGVDVGVAPQALMIVAATMSKATTR